MAPPAPALTAALAVASVALLVAAIVFLLLWLRAARRARRVLGAERAAEAAVSQLELSVADRSGRLRIVRELHDVVVHRVATMVTQADGARYAGSTDPTAAVRAAGAVAELGRATLADLRRVMTIVRETEDRSGPAPGIADLRALVAVLREHGLAVEVDESGEPFQLNPGAGIAVYRVLQEALDNALRVGGTGTLARIGITWTANGLAVRVDDTAIRNRVEQRVSDPDEVRAELAYTALDDLRALTQEITGPGIQEMRARAELYGGSLTVTEVPGVGYSVTAAFPTIRFHNGVHGVDLS